MKNRRLIIWKSKEDCVKYYKSKDWMTPELQEKYVSNSMKYGNYLAVSSIKEIMKDYDINVIGGI